MISAPIPPGAIPIRPLPDPQSTINRTGSPFQVSGQLTIPEASGSDTQDGHKPNDRPEIPGRSFVERMVCYCLIA
jgi:hypothetical protein